MNADQNKINGRCGYIFDIKRFAIHDGPGIRTTVFFKGCPLRCWWCHNPESHKVLPENFDGCNIKRSYNRLISDDESGLGKEVDVEYLMYEIEKDRIFYEESGGGVTFSGGEPFMQPEFLISVLKRCKANDINTTIDTSGYARWETMEPVFDFTDLFLFDLKVIDPKLHEKYTGVSNELILGNLLKLDHLKRKYFLRIPMVPGFTDTENNIKELTKLISSLKNVDGINLLPYHRAGVGKYDKYKKVNKLPDTPAPSDKRMNELKNIFKQFHEIVLIGG